MNLEDRLASQEEFIKALQIQVDYFRELFENERDRNDRLTAALLKQFGLDAQSGEIQVPIGDSKPIATGRRGWSQIRDRLEAKLKRPTSVSTVEELKETEENASA